MKKTIRNNVINWGARSKNELVWLLTHRCTHGHTYAEHPNCFFVEHPQGIPQERVGYLDIEATNLHATFGYMLSYAILGDDNTMYGRVLTPEEIHTGNFDKILSKQASEDIQAFDRLVVYWGKSYRFDIPYIRTRALKWGHDFPVYKEVYVTDCYDLVKSKLKLHKNRLETACYFFDIPTKEHRLSFEMWQQAMAGKEKALNYVWEHNKEDVYSLRELYHKLMGFDSQRKVSI